jgi:hypothetical protein
MEMLIHRLNPGEAIHTFELDLSGFDPQSNAHFNRSFREYLGQIDPAHRAIYKYKPGRSIRYQTELLIPKPNPQRINLMMVLGNPADHSVCCDMFFSYKKSSVKDKWQEHPFWRALKESGILNFCKDFGRPERGSVNRINNDRKNALLDGDYDGRFNLFLVPYFSFPTPASGIFNGVDGIRKLFGREIFRAYRDFEAARFKELIDAHQIKHLICFHKLAREEIQARHHEALKVYNAGPTRHILSGKSLATLRKLAKEIRKK